MFGTFIDYLKQWWLPERSVSQESTRTQSNIRQLTNDTIVQAVDKFCSSNPQHVEEVTETFGHISDWNTSMVTNMSKLFYKKYNFNEDISRWDVSNVRNMEGMFCGAYCFNSNISSWNVSNVTNMRFMFMDAHAFNIDLNTWDVSNVSTMYGMFMNAKTFNGNICDWKINKNVNLVNMFWGAFAFEQNLSNWDIKCARTEEMFVNSGLSRDKIVEWSNINFVCRARALCQVD